MEPGSFNVSKERNAKAPCNTPEATSVPAKATAGPAKANAAPTKATAVPSKAAAAPVLKSKAGGNETRVRADKAKTATTSASANKKRPRDDQDSATGEIAQDAPKRTSKNNASNNSTSVSSSLTKAVSVHPSTSKGKALAKSIDAQHITKTVSISTGSTSESSSKRTKGFKSRRGPSFQGAEAGNALMLSEVPLEFSTTCYYVQLGDDGQIFFIHEYHLSKSPRLCEEVKTAKSKLRKTQQQIIQLLPHDAGAFGQLVGYLYSDQFKTLECNKQKKMIGHRMKEIHEVMSLAKYYDMPGLQKDIMRVVVKERILQKVNAAAFFDWAEDMWYEEMDTGNGPFAKYLQRHAPTMLLSATDKDFKSMMKFIGGGGGYVKEIFWAMHKAISLGGMQTVKPELETINMP